MSLPSVLSTKCIAVAVLMAFAGACSPEPPPRTEVVSLPPLRNPTAQEVARFGLDPADQVLAVLSEAPGKPHDYVAVEFRWTPYTIHYHCEGDALLIQELFDLEPGGQVDTGSDGPCSGNVIPSRLTSIVLEDPEVESPLPEVGGRAELSVVAQRAQPGWGVMLVVKSHQSTPKVTRPRPPTRSEIARFGLERDAEVLAALPEGADPNEPRSIGFPYRPYRVLGWCSRGERVPSDGEEFVEVQETSQAVNGEPLSSIREFFCTMGGFDGDGAPSREYLWKNMVPSRGTMVHVTVFASDWVDWSFLVVAAEDD